jgi:hypothetical protein
LGAKQLGRKKSKKMTGERDKVENKSIAPGVLKFADVQF